MKRLFLFLLFLLLTAALIGCESEETERELIVPTRILRSDTDSGAGRDGAVRLRSELESRCGLAVDIETDWVNRGEEVPALNCELVVGVTNRAESEAEYESLRDARPNSALDWSIVELDGSVLITGVSDEALLEAVDYFIENYLVEGGISMTKGEHYVYNREYASLSIDGCDILEYSLTPTDIPFVSGAWEYLRDKITDAVGCEPSGAKPISFSLDDTLDEGTYKITAGKDEANISGAGYDELRYAMLKFWELLSGGSASGTISEAVGLHAPVVEQPESSGGYTSVGDLMYLIDDEMNLNSGWDRVLVSTDYKLEASYSSSYFAKVAIQNTNIDEPCLMKREFLAQDSGVVYFETELSLAKVDGGRIGIYNSSDGKYAALLTMRGGELYANDETSLGAGSTRLKLRVVVDLDASSYTVYVNGSDCGSFDFTDDTDSIDTIVFALDAGAKNKIAPNFVYLYRNAAILERFRMNPADSSPLGFDVVGDVKVPSDEDARLSGDASIKKSFAAFDGKAVFEVKLLAESFDGTVYLSLGSGSDTAFTLKLADMSVLHGDDRLRLYDRDFWYTLRVEADTRTGCAEVKVNGKSHGYFELDAVATSFDSIEIRTEGASVRVDDVMVYQINDYDDYVPAPLSSGSDGYYVAAQVCSLWKNGHHCGWDCITPYDELKPVLGYYDEGIVEVADWEIKYMAEHGVDYQLYCWYSTEVDRPIKHPNMNEALHDGYFHARYSDKIKFAIMWENANAAHPGSSENFRNVIVPYWVEYYLTDPRYMTIDNKPVITVFSVDQLIKDFGSVEGVKAEFDYLREVCRGLGYDGALIFCQAATYSQSVMDNVKAFGADAVYAYNWGKSNTSSEYINNVSRQHASGMDTIPTISVGFNNVGWAGTRSELITPDDYKVALEWVRDVYSENYDDDSWLAKSIVLSTWNEYGEGTYIMPSGLHGFDYLDMVREVFAPDNEYENLVPTENQQKRLGTLFPQERKILRADYRLSTVAYDSLEPIVSWSFDTSAEGWSQGFGLSEFKYDSGKGAITGSSKESDFSVMSPDNLSISLAGAAAIKISMKCDTDGRLEVFYTTNDHSSFVQNQSFNVAVKKSDDFVDYYLPVGEKSTFSGILKQLRVDPLAAPCSFEIASVELLGEGEIYRLTSNGQTFDFNSFKPVDDNGVLMVPFDPKTGMLTFMSCGYEWVDTEDTIVISHNGHTLELRVGSDAALLDGNEQKLSRAVGSVDGLPLLPIDDVMSLLAIDDVSVVVEELR